MFLGQVVVRIMSQVTDWMLGAVPLGTKTKLEMIFDLDLWSLQILGIQHLAGRFIIGLGFPYNAFWNSPALGGVQVGIKSICLAIKQHDFQEVISNALARANLFATITKT